LSDSPAINMRNIPKNSEYFALLIEFDDQDFYGLQNSTLNKQRHHIGQTTSVLEKCLHQFVQSALWAPKQLWGLRKREILELLCHMGHKQVLSMVGNTKLAHRLHDMFCAHGIHAIQEITNEYIAKQLAMSDSTIRRKLNAEGTSIQEIKDQARLGLGLHLLQTTRQPISVIADKCGYQSQSRFTDRFRRRFGLTPSELRKTKMVN
jgi:AraC-like DNA-binding protein